MDPTTPYRAVALLFLGSIVPLSAQNFSEASRPADVRLLAVADLEGRDAQRFQALSLPGTYEVPATKAAAHLNESGGLFVAQDAATLGARKAATGDVESVVDLSTLREPSPFRKVAMAAGTSATEATAKGLSMGLALLSATYRAPGEAAEGTNCSALGLSVQQRVKLDPSKILEIVEGEISANQGCSCEVVKAALSAAGADAALTAQVVEAATTAAPESMRLISQCAIATVPESLPNVQAVLAKLDPNSGESGYSSKGSSKSSKSGKEIIPPPPPIRGNPLDLPPLGPPLPPPPFNPPPITDVDNYIPVD